MDRFVLRSAVQQTRMFVWGSLAFASFWVAVAVNALGDEAPRGRSLFTRLVFAPVFEVGGAAAVAAVYLGLALCGVAAARFVWRRTPKVPADRWWRW